MKLMLDTSVLIGYLNDKPDVVTRLVAYKSREVCFSSIVLLEALTSVHLGQQRRANRANVAAAGHKYAVAPFDGRAATCAAALFAKHDIKGDRAPVFDGLIAAHAQSLDVPIAYIDGDFNRFAIKKQLWARSAA